MKTQLIHQQVLFVRLQPISAFSCRFSIRTSRSSRSPAAGAAGAALGLEGAEGRFGGASPQHGVAVTAIGALAGGLRLWRWRRLLPAAPQSGTPHLQHLVEHRQQQDHQHGQHHPWTPWGKTHQEFVLLLSRRFLIVLELLHSLRRYYIICLQFCYSDERKQTGANFNRTLG